MTAELPDNVWFLMWRRRLRPVRREGRVAVAGYYVATIAMGVFAVVLAAFLSPLFGIAVGVAGIGGMVWWFTAFTRRHADYSISYDDYVRQSK